MNSLFRFVGFKFPSKFHINIDYQENVLAVKMFFSDLNIEFYSFTLPQDKLMALVMGGIASTKPLSEPRLKTQVLQVLLMTCHSDNGPRLLYNGFNVHFSLRYWKLQKVRELFKSDQIFVP